MDVGIALSFQTHDLDGAEDHRNALFIGRMRFWCPGCECGPPGSGGSELLHEIRSDPTFRRCVEQLAASSIGAAVVNWLNDSLARIESDGIGLSQQTAVEARGEARPLQFEVPLRHTDSFADTGFVHTGVLLARPSAVFPAILREISQAGGIRIPHMGTTQKVERAGWVPPLGEETDDGQTPRSPSVPFVFPSEYRQKDSQMTTHEYDADVLIVGGGLAGLTAATFLARAGRRVLLFERSWRSGGRAITDVREGFAFNLGPHAVYNAGPAASVLNELGIEPSGGVPSAGGLALRAGATHRLPVGPRSLLATRLLGPLEKMELARIFSTIGKLNTKGLETVTFAQWLDAHVRRSGVREMLEALARLASYANAPHLLSAAVALGQIQLAVSGVRYLDGGWQQLVDALQGAAREAGAELVLSAGVSSVSPEGGAWTVRLKDGVSLRTPAAIIAGSPWLAAELVGGVPGSLLKQWAAPSVPVRAAILDLGLRHLPQARNTFALGIDAPTYLSVHSKVADLTPAGASLVHVAKYLTPNHDGGGAESELEAVMDTVQPGWREAVSTRRFLPHMVVSNALATAQGGGLVGRPGPAVPDAPGLYVAGDWVGPQGWLSDASFASARDAATAILAAPLPPISYRDAVPQAVAAAVG